ncbi:DUF4333 domain-containing protein [Kibdelosporangium lantanae]|uniref:DUF4333 domain-containing protein n=1 Tax=Kibdelosporangium lantanae TaxID=1497396 RepID=A0ABW3M5S3_9PSEU
MKRVLVVLSLVAVAGCGSNRQMVLDGKTVEQGVTTVLVEKYEIDASDVRCPDNEEIKVGNMFDCSVKVSGQPKKVTLTIQDDKGTYDIGYPE